MRVGLVGADGPPLGVAKGDVDADADALGKADGPDVALDEARLLELLVAHEVVLAEGVLGLDVVHLVVAGDEDDGGATLAVDEGERLARGRLGDGEEAGDVLDRGAARGLDALELAGLAVDDVDRGAGGLGVGREAAVVAVDELGLAGVGDCHELDGGVAADLAGVGHDGQGPEADALADAGVGGLLLVVALLQGLLGGGEGVAVLHDELAPTHESEARTKLVSELVLDVVEGQRELLVAAQLVADEVGEGLLVGGAERELVVVAVGDAHELGAVGVPAAALVPERGVGEDRGEHLLRVDGLHLVADDVLDLAQRAPGERQVGVEAGGAAADHAGAQQQAVARELGLGGVFLKRRGVEPRHPHVLSQRESSNSWVHKREKL